MVIKLGIGWLVVGIAVLGAPRFCILRDFAEFWAKIRAPPNRRLPPPTIWPAIGPFRIFWYYAAQNDYTYKSLFDHTLPNYSQAKKEVIQQKMLLRLIGKHMSFSTSSGNSSGRNFYLNSEMSGVWGPCFCPPSSRVLGQVQVRQVGSHSRAQKTRCQLNNSIS